MKNLNHEMIEKAKTAKSAEELLALAKETGVEMTEDEAKTYFAQLNPKGGEISDDDLDNVSGGACSGSSSGDSGFACEKWACATCGGTAQVDGACANCHVNVACTQCKYVVRDPDGSYFCGK